MPTASVDISAVIESIHDKSPVSGFTHNFYRYPARFSPLFASAAIRAFTKPGEIVYDPFMGGGTTLVESMRLGRRAIGTDLNSLAVFVAKAKTTILTDRDIEDLRAWVEIAQPELVLSNKTERHLDWIELGYQRNISGRTTWPVRKTLELALSTLDLLKNERQRNFVRCLLLKTAQWAVDCRKHPASAHQIRQQLVEHSTQMLDGVVELRKCFERTELETRRKLKPVCLHCSAEAVSANYQFAKSPRLIVTSPPYPGVHVLYHRWQVNGRKETPAPYWIANCMDGRGSSYYTFGDRKQERQEGYFESMRKCYSALASISDKETWLVQLVAFSKPEWQLSRFLETMGECGFTEVLLHDVSDASDGRNWRIVPNRKFYADRQGKTPSSQEVLLVHRLS